MMYVLKFNTKQLWPKAKTLGYFSTTPRIDLRKVRCMYYTNLSYFAFSSFESSYSLKTTRQAFHMDLVLRSQVGEMEKEEGFPKG